MSQAYNSMLGFLCGQLAQGKCPTNRELIERYRVPIIREQIASGTYESDRKLGVAADALLDEINRELLTKVAIFRDTAAGFRLQEVTGGVIGRCLCKSHSMDALRAFASLHRYQLCEQSQARDATEHGERWDGQS